MFSKAVELRAEDGVLGKPGNRNVAKGTCDR
jgi:hypothetical protein